MKKIYILFSVFIIATCFIAGNAVTAQSININGPAGSGSFGSTVTVLPNGNYVVTDPLYDDGAVVDVGAVYLYNGSTHALISTLKGSTNNDQVGAGGIFILTNGNFIVASRFWNGIRGAVTLGNSTNGISGIVSSGNSLVGSTASDQIGNSGVSVLNNGNYLVKSPYWDNGAVLDAGAVTWGNGTTGITGVVSSSNSLVGGKANDNVGSTGIDILSNGNYVVRSYYWDNGAATEAGAVTWGNATTGITGLVSSSNSLIGTKTNDGIGLDGIIILGNGNYVVRSYSWDNGAAINAGAVTWGNGTAGISGVLSSSNSLVGSKTNDNVGYYGIAVLSNNNYVVPCIDWDNAAVVDAGAATWCSGTAGRTGIISSSNSLVGNTASDYVGGGITVLSNGNYVVISPNWGNTNVGAATWGNGTVGTVGLISSINSLVGSSLGDNISSGGITALSNGNYVVLSYTWDNGALTNSGAATWANGTIGRVGIVSSSNSLIGGSAQDNISNYGITELTNGNYVIKSTNWRNGAAIQAGAVTWASGTTGITGVVSSSNSLVGSTIYDQVGYGSITILPNGNYLVGSYSWDNGTVMDVGALTWCNGSTGKSGVVNAVNSLVGNTADDEVGAFITVLSNGNYVVKSPSWNNGAIADAGAVTWGNGTTGISGVVSSSNSLVGSTSGDFDYNTIIGMSNGNYIVKSFDWDNGPVINAGAVTWGNGATGTSGVISSSNSLVGSTAYDRVGAPNINLLSNGNYVVRTNAWHNGALVNAGAVTWGSGTSGVSGVISSSNSLVGNKANDYIGGRGVNVLSNGNYVISSSWNNGTSANAGAVTWANGSMGINGFVNSTNSLVGSLTGDVEGFSSAPNASIYIIRSSGFDYGTRPDVGAITVANANATISGFITSCNSVTGLAEYNGNNLRSFYNSVYGYIIVARVNDNIVTIYNLSALSLANTLDTIMVNVTATDAVPFIASTGCRIIATLTPNGASAVNGLVNAKAWIEPSVPTHAGQPFVARHFEITPATNTSTATGNVTLYFTQQEFDDFNGHANSILDLPTGASDATGKANLRIGKYPGNSSNGSGLPGTYSGTASVIDPVDADIVWNNSLNRWEVSFNVTGFSGFIVQTHVFVLPLTLLEFNGRLQNNNGLLNWKTTNELNTHSFDVERSMDGRTYTKVGNVVAFNTAGDHQYNFTDHNINLLSSLVIYYRLKQKDINGRFTYSSIVALSIDDSKSIVLFYPNPVTTEANLTITVNKAQQVQGRIIDNAGRVIKQLQWNLLGGSTALLLDVKGLASGRYYLELKGETINERKAFVKQ